MSALAPSDVPVLPRGVRTHWCKVREDWFLLAPERAIRLDGPAAAILERIDGARDVAAIGADLAATFDAPPDRLTGDTAKFLGDLRARRMVEVLRP